jgi:hypothetical protein
MGQTYSVFQQYPIELWQDKLALEFALGKCLERMKKVVVRDGYELGEETRRFVIFQKWVPDWTRVTKHWIFRKPRVPGEYDEDYGLIQVTRRGLFWIRTEESKEGSFIPSTEANADQVGIQISWDTSKPFPPPAVRTAEGS